MAAGKFVTARTVEDAGPYNLTPRSGISHLPQANISHCESNISHRRKAVYRSSPKAMTFNAPLRHASRATSPQGARQGSVDAELVATVGVAICRPWGCAESAAGAKASLVKGGGFLRSKKTEGLVNTYRTPNNPPVSAYAEPAPFTQGGLGGCRGLVQNEIQKTSRCVCIGRLGFTEFPKRSYSPAVP